MTVRWVVAVASLAVAACQIATDIKLDPVPETSEELCVDERDGDVVGLTDCQDWNCLGVAACCDLPEVLLEDSFSGGPDSCDVAACSDASCLETACGADAERWHAWACPFATVCGGMLKPDEVFFGEYVPQDRFKAAESLIRASDALIVVGSSLVVNSGVRLIERARRRGIPLVIINREPTRADPWAHATLAAGTSTVLPALQELLS